MLQSCSIIIIFDNLFFVYPGWNESGQRHANTGMLFPSHLEYNVQQTLVYMDGEHSTTQLNERQRCELCMEPYSLQLQSSFCWLVSHGKKERVKWNRTPHSFFNSLKNAVKNDDEDEYGMPPGWYFLNVCWLHIPWIRECASICGKGEKK